jgi:NTE family protein
MWLGIKSSSTWRCWNWQKYWKNNMDICLALGGGGIKGVAHIGVLECLEKAGFRIRAIAGTSAGGLAGAIYAAGYSPMEILTILESLNKSRLYTRQSTDGPSLLGYTGLANALTEILGECQFSDLKIPFACTAVDMRTSREIYLDEGCVLDAVLATIAIPGIFPPKKRGDAELIDGAVLNPVPVNLARQMAPRLPIVAVALNLPQEQWHQIPEFNLTPPMPFSIPSPLVEGFAHMRIGQSIRIFLHSIDITALMLTELRLKVDRPDVIIRPAVSQYGILDVIVPKELVQAGYQAAEQALPQIYNALSWIEGMRRTLRTLTNRPALKPASRLPNKHSGPITQAAPKASPK